MPQQTSKISAKSAGIIAALVVPMLLVPTSSQARSDYQTRSSAQDWSFLNLPIKVKQGDYETNQKSDGKALRRFFDKPAPPKSKAMNKARNKRLNRAHRGRSSSSRRHGYNGDYYEDNVAYSCVSPRKIHRKLRAQGWRNFHNLKIRRNALMFKARQRHQRTDVTYNLRIDRCSGSLIKAQIQRRDMWVLRWMRRLSSLY